MPNMKGWKSLWSLMPISPAFSKRTKVPLTVVFTKEDETADSYIERLAGEK